MRLWKHKQANDADEAVRKAEDAAERATASAGQAAEAARAAGASAAEAAEAANAAAGNETSVLSERRFQFLLSWEVDLQEAARKRMDAEHIYTAGAVGAFVAFAVGVATINTRSLPPVGVQTTSQADWWQSPFVIASVAVFGIALAVAYKIVAEHRAYTDIRAEQIRVAGLLKEAAGLRAEDVPLYLSRSSMNEVGRPAIWVIVAFLPALIVGAARRILRSILSRIIGTSPGYVWSLLILASAAGGSISFSLALYFFG